MCGFFIYLITFIYIYIYIYWTLFSFVIVILHCRVFVDTPSSTFWHVVHWLLVVVCCCCPLSSLWIGSLTLVLSSPFFIASERKEIRNSSFKFNFFQGEFLKNKLFIFLGFFILCLYVCMWPVSMYVFQFFLLHLFCMLTILGLLFVCKVYYSHHVVLVIGIICTFLNINMKLGEKNDGFEWKWKHLHKAKTKTCS
jgi:hypothetical protein